MYEQNQKTDVGWCNENENVGFRFLQSKVTLWSDFSEKRRRERVFRFENVLLFEFASFLIKTVTRDTSKLLSICFRLA